ncbi:helicase C-terminal domain-containing protein [Geopsychrobacter electrodiphilus]|uniref:helicase C-terminal domain-containing protein n=1 Tax=Geopsychrobacter electrodiphilus TaxID=225196 RepID=UPI0004774061|nr:helicase C-terminal domain-containing protein [Geopsychrobacter electrodiphilus]
MQKRFSIDARMQLQAAIAEAGGNEVFALGHTDADCRVVELDVLARGSQQAVPAVLNNCSYGDIIIHNHPSGNLSPSEPDIQIASGIASLGVGFYIVDNAVDKIYAVVEPFAPQDETQLDPARIDAILGTAGQVAQQLPGYEDRPEQLRMALCVAEAFNRGQLAVIEAGTGTGKSLAYLVPALLWALNNGERVVVSTNTINLQQQLISKDLPLLRRATGLEFRAVLVKGRSNYLCLRRSDEAGREPGLFVSNEEAELRQILQWGEATSDGSRDDLGFNPQPSVWEEVCCEADQCSRVRCRFYAKCFFHKARRQAAQANLLVVNHALLLSDLALRQQTDNYNATAVLPPFGRVVIDEAHHLEDVATSYFSGQVTRFVFARTLNRLRHPRKPDKGLLPRFLSQLAKELPDSFDELYRGIHERVETLQGLRQTLLDEAVEALDLVGQRLARELKQEIREGFDLRHRLKAEFFQTGCWDEIVGLVKPLLKQSKSLARKLDGLLSQCEELPDAVADKLSSPLVDLAGIARRLDGIAADLNLFLGAAEENCVWIEVSKGRIGRARGNITKLCSAPLEVGKGLNEALYERFRTVVLTSATLSVAGRFDYFCGRTGLDLAEVSRLQSLVLASPFDYQTQALVAVPTDIPEPGRPGFDAAIAELTEKALLLAGGRSFVLFTAYQLLTNTYEALAPLLEAHKIHALRQGSENRHLLLKRFAEDETSVLFGTDSFWEGVDVPGRSLEQVIITRLPFRVPTEPVLQARAEALEARGQDPFMKYTVPQAVIRFKQGFGRLIRNRSDRGVVLILDSRVVRRGYGRTFLRSLPEAQTLNLPTAELLPRIASFFADSSD